MEKIQSTEEYFKLYSNLYSFEEGDSMYLIDKEDYQKTMIEFAKYHCTQALKEASEKGNIKIEQYHEDTHSISIIKEKEDEPFIGRYADMDGCLLGVDVFSIDKDSILNAYPLNLIK